jgi:hypothetical protein
MTDAEMIAWLRRQADWCRSQNALSPEDWCRKIAARLEELAAPAAGSPIAPARLGEIRGDDRECGALPPRPSMAAHHDRRDLLAAYDFERLRADECEAMVANSFDDTKVARLAAEGARAEVLSLVRSMLESRRMHALVALDLARRMHEEVAGVLEVLEKVLTHPEEPRRLPHEASLARLRRLEGALRRIAGGEGDGDDVSWADSSRMWQQIAREALKEDAP